MKAILNRSLFTQTDADSGALTVHGAVVHALDEPCTYDGTVLRGREVVGRFTIEVDDHCGERQLNLDLLSVDGTAALRQAADAHRLATGGSVVFWVSRGRGGYGVVLERRGGSAKQRFDSRSLRSGDYFTAHPLRPGVYRATNSKTKAEARIVIDYPNPQKPSPRAEPCPIRVTEKGFQPKSARIHPLQGIVFQIDAPSRIRLQLVEATERPRGMKPRRPRDGRPKGGSKGRARS